MKNYNISDYELATFAGGCFWCMEGPFEDEEGVIDVIVGYTGGHSDAPTYEEVSSGKTGHVESIQIVYDSTKISYESLLDIFWRQIDPTDDAGQFVDRGDQYVSAIFYHNEQQRIMAEKSKKNLSNSAVFDKSIVTQIIAYDKFYVAENYHQDYYRRNPLRYKFYRSGSGRDDFLNKVWVERRKKELREKLTPIQFDVTQNNATEPAFKNEYWDEMRDGIYVDIVSGDPLFSSIDKYDSGTGWPSFTKPIEPKNIVEKTDSKFFVKRTEIRSKKADSHLGHMFNDGPKNSIGFRYCMNSAALRFIVKEDLEKEGYGKYLRLFE